MKAFVTGSTGLLGSNLVRALLGNGAQVTALCRDEAKAGRVLPGDVRVVQGDVCSVTMPQFLRQSSSDVLFHCAAYYREYRQDGGDHWDHLERTNVRATANLLDAAEAAGLRRVVYVSSTGVFGPPTKGAEIDEDTGHADSTQNLYFRSKILAEREVQDWRKAHDLSVVTILPGWMFGPWDEAPTAGGRFVQKLLAGGMRVVPSGGASVVDARDVAAAMIRAAQVDDPEPRYLVAGRRVSLIDLARSVDPKTFRIPLPHSLAFPAAFAVQQLTGLLGRRSPVTTGGLRTMRDGLRFRYSSARSERDLGVSFRPVQETLDDQVNWYRQRASGKVCP